jgi:hypothetical protein
MNRLVTSDGPETAELGSLSARSLTASIEEVDGQTGVVLDDDDGVVELSEAFGPPGTIARAYKRVAATLLARAAMLDAEAPCRNRGET